MEHEQEQWDQHFSEWNKSVGKGSHKGWNKGYKGYQKDGSMGSFNDVKGVGKGDNKDVFKGEEKAARVAASMGIAIGAGSGASLNRAVAKRTRSWRTRGGMARAIPRVVSIRSPTMSKRTRTRWRTWRKMGSLFVLFRTPWQSLCYFEPVRRIARTRG